MQKFFTDIGMELIAVDRVQSHGGSLRGVAQRAGGPKLRESSVDLLIDLESRLGLHDVEVFKDFENKIQTRSIEVREYLLGLKSGGRNIAGYGAPAKATTLMYHFNIGPDLIDFIVDDSPIKQGLYSPGLHIPILASSSINELKPDYLLILAWNFADSIIKKNREFSESGGKFIIPLPNLKII